MTPVFGILGEMSLIHWLIVGGLGILLFGKRLPEVGRSLGKGIKEFQKGFKGLEDDVDINPSTPHSAPHHDKPAIDTSIRPPQRIQATTPKFDNGPANPPAGPSA
jgi:sec-independent protein translocase protein TatA